MPEFWWSAGEFRPPSPLRSEVPAYSGVSSFPPSFVLSCFLSTSMLHIPKMSQMFYSLWTRRQRFRDSLLSSCQFDYVYTPIILPYSKPVLLSVLPLFSDELNASWCALLCAVIPRLIMLTWKKFFSQTSDRCIKICEKYSLVETCLTSIMINVLHDAFLSFQRQASVAVITRGSASTGTETERHCSVSASGRPSCLLYIKKPVSAAYKHR